MCDVNFRNPIHCGLLISFMTISRFLLEANVEAIQNVLSRVFIDRVLREFVKVEVVLG